MLDKRRVREIRRLVAARNAFIELTTGPPLYTNPLVFDDDTSAISIGSIGNEHNIDFGRLVIDELWIPVDSEFKAQGLTQGRDFNHVTALVYIEPRDELSALKAGNSIRGNRLRALLSLVTGGEHQPLARIDWHSPRLAEVEFISPRYRGISARHTDDPINEAFIKAAAGAGLADEQLHYFIAILEQIHAANDHAFKIARYFSLLEAMTAQLSAQFQKQIGKSSVRHAIRYALKYFIAYDVPRFTLEPDTDFEFDHIELAGRVRHKLFHGGGELTAKDAGLTLEHALPLLKARPDMIAHRLRRDCEIILAQWADRRGTAWRAANGDQFILPARNPNYDGKTLAKCLITSSKQTNSAIASVMVQVTGADIGLVRFSLNGFNPPPGS